MIVLRPSSAEAVEAQATCPANANREAVTTGASATIVINLATLREIAGITTVEAGASVGEGRVIQAHATTVGSPATLLGTALVEAANAKARGSATIVIRRGISPGIVPVKLVHGNESCV